jgi:hypothetical protein
VHVYRWDLDRTYLDTEIHSVRGLVRAAFEHAADKKTVPGAAALLKALVAHDPAARIYILSGSPTQMRAVLEAKLALDGVRIDGLFLKDNLGNLRRGRLRAVRGQIGYKLPQLLEDRIATPAEDDEMLFGDDSETDALIYATYAAILAGRIGEDMLVKVLNAGRAYPDAIDRAVAAARRLAKGDAVKDIFIRIDRGIPVATYRLLGPNVIPVFSWFQAALVLAARGRLPESALSDIATASGEPSAISGLVVDAVRRGLVDPETAARALDVGDTAPIAASVRKVVGRMGVAPIPGPAEPDFFGFFEAVRAR